MSDFINRTEEVATLLQPPSRMVNVYGESGIGKSRLLIECKTKFENTKNGLFILINLEDIRRSAGRPEIAVLRSLISQVSNSAEETNQSSEKAATALVTQLSYRAQIPGEEVFVVFDTAEVYQTDRAFWDWMEHNLLRPLIIRGKINLIVSGRLPVAWEDFEIRRIQDFLKISPLASPRIGLPEDAITSSKDNASAEIFANSLLCSIELPEGSTTNTIVDVLVDLSQGHPLLIQKMVKYLSENTESLPSPNLKALLSEKITYHFIVGHLFEGIQEPWDQLIWWMSVLDHFDSTFLREFLVKVAPQDVGNKPDYYFIQGINALRKQSTLIWKERQGERFHGVTGQIIRKCFEYTRNKDFFEANRMAAQTYRELANQFLADDETLRNEYEKTALMYENRAKR